MPKTINLGKVTGENAKINGKNSIILNGINGITVTTSESGETTISNITSKPYAFSVSDNDWSEITEPFAGCRFKAEIVAENVSTSDYPDVFFNSTSIEAATTAVIIVNAEAGVVALYAKNKPASTLAGTYFIKKGATPE